jgi:PEGA domain
VILSTLLIVFSSPFVVSDLHTVLVLQEGAPQNAVLMKECPAPCDIITADPQPEALETHRELLQEARATMKRANEQIFNLQTGPAIKSFERALALYARSVPVWESISEYEKCLVDLASALITARRPARDAFERALAINPKLALNADLYSPEVMDELRAARKSAAARKHVSVSVSGTPAGAAVHWDGQQVGEAPVTITDVPVGEHWLLVTAPGKTRFSVIVSSVERTERVEVFLKDPTTHPEEIVLSAADLGAKTASDEEKRAFSTLADKAHADRVLVVSRDGNTRRYVSASLAIDTPGRSALFADVAKRTDPRRSDDSLRLAQPRTLENAAQTQARVHPALAAIPFGGGQFAAKRYGAGAAFLVTEAALLATNIGCYFAAKGLRQPDGTYNDPTRATALGIVANVALGLLLAELIGGLVEGEARR